MCTETKMIKVSDAIVEYLIALGITNVFGYPGGMIVHLMDSFNKYNKQISFRMSYHEQGAAFEACAYSQVSRKPGIVLATSGPGATNLVTGIANAYFDSIPLICITGQVNVDESSRGYQIRQRGFQETNVVDLVKPIVKASFYVSSPQECLLFLKKAYHIAISGRKGPVLLDIPMNVQRSMIELSSFSMLIQNLGNVENVGLTTNINVNELLNSSRRPVIILGNGIKQSSKYEQNVVEELTKKKVPFVLTLPAVDLMQSDKENNLGMIGAYGMRLANIAVNKSDLIISLGARLDIRQVGGIRNRFAPNAKIIRVDIDENELNYQIRDDEVDLRIDVIDFIRLLNKVDFDRVKWLNCCLNIKKILNENNIDKLATNDIVSILSRHINENSLITTDVGQNQMWIAQSFFFKGQKMLTSAGLGSMGYSLPAAIGAYYANPNINVVSFNGDGGFQMNIQELGMVSRERLPIKIVIFNNEALGMIRCFQENYFDGHYFLTTKETGYANPHFEFIAKAYGLEYSYIEALDDNSNFSIFNDKIGRIIELGVKYPTYVYPKLKYAEANDNQIPYLPKDLLEKIRGL